MKPHFWIPLPSAFLVSTRADLRIAAAGQPKCANIQEAGATAPFLGFKYLSQAEELWGEAEKSVEGQPELRTRVRVARRQPLRKECIEAGAVWPMPGSRKDFAEGWLAWLTRRTLPGRA